MFIVLFILTGMILYFSDYLWLRLRKELYFTSYLLSGILVGLTVGLILKIVSASFQVSWILLPIVTVPASLCLGVFAFYDLYGKPFFQIFGTISLGVLSGVGAFLILLILTSLFSEAIRLSRSWPAMLLDMVIYGFLLNFGYSFIGRRHKLRQRRRESRRE